MDKGTIDSICDWYSLRLSLQRIYGMEKQHSWGAGIGCLGFRKSDCIFWSFACFCVKFSKCWWCENRYSWREGVMLQELHKIAADVGTIVRFSHLFWSFSGINLGSFRQNERQGGKGIFKKSFARSSVRTWKMIISAKLCRTFPLISCSQAKHS